jgi:hypothetical protein
MPGHAVPAVGRGRVDGVLVGAEAMKTFTHNDCRN